MVLDQYVRDLKVFMDEFATALEAERTKLYLDTSMLIWLIRLGATARAEILAWFRSRPADTVRVPVWAAHELHRHILNNTARKNLDEAASDLTKKYDHFVRMVAERADDSVCITKGYQGRSSFMTELELTSVRLERLVKVAALDDKPLQDSTKEVIDFANERMLSTDLSPIVKKLNRTGKFRVSHLMPPGFQDKKDENAYGDIVIWEEIIKDIRHDERAGESRDVVFISRDKKTDWVSAAPYVLDERGHVHRSNREEEMDVSEAHPLLAHELVEIAGGKRLYITQPGFLASVLDYGYRKKGQPSKVVEWLTASHRPDILSKLAARKTKDPETPKTDTPPAPAAEPAEQAPPVAASPKDFITLCRAECATYLKATAEEQAALLNDWVGGVVKGSIPPAKLGCILAELALGGATGVKERIPALLERLLDIAEEGKVLTVVTATITAAYFDPYGELRPSPDLSLGSIALVIEKQERFKKAFDSLNAFLKSANAELPYLPGTGTKKVKFIVDHAEVAAGAARSIRGIRINDQSVLIDALPEGSRRGMATLLGKPRVPGCLGKDIRFLISQQFLIPLDCLSDNFDRTKFTWQPDAGLVALDTSSPGGLSAAVDEESQ